MKKIIIILMIVCMCGCGKSETKESITSKGLENLKSTNYINYCEGYAIDSLGDRISESNISIDKENNVVYKFNNEVLSFNSKENKVSTFVKNQDGVTYKMEMDFSKMNDNIITLKLLDSEEYIVAYDTLYCTNSEYYQK